MKSSISAVSMIPHGDARDRRGVEEERRGELDIHGLPTARPASRFALRHPSVPPIITSGILVPRCSIHFTRPMAWPLVLLRMRRCSVRRPASRYSQARRSGTKPVRHELIPGCQPGATYALTGFRVDFPRAAQLHQTTAFEHPDVGRMAGFVCRASRRGSSHPGRGGCAELHAQLGAQLASSEDSGRP